MLAVDDEEFWAGVQLLDISPDLPPMQQGVTVVGFPTGGDNVCVTKGVVSRLDRQQVGGVGQAWGVCVSGRQLHNAIDHSVVLQQYGCSGATAGSSQAAGPCGIWRMDQSDASLVQDG